MSHVGKEIKSLKFIGQHLERAYLNEQRVHERFTASSGAISAWVAKVSKKGDLKLGVPVIQFGGGAESANEVTYDITDPVAQALLLRASVEGAKMVKPLEKASALQYVVVSGLSCFRHPSLPEAGWHTPACQPTEELEKRRADAELFHKPFDEGASVWLLMMQLPGGGIAACVGDRKWVNDGVIPCFFHRSWTTFGVLEDRIGSAPLITPISVFVDYPK
jgi:hypothetical protein